MSSFKILRNLVLGAAASTWLLASAPAKAEIFLVKKAQADDWEVSTNGRVDAYLNWIGGKTINVGNSGNLTKPGDPTSIDRYTLVGPQISIRGNPTPTGATASPTDSDLNTFRIRGGFASTILAFNIYKQVLPNLKLSMKLAFWAGIQNGLNSQNYRQFNDSASVDFREQYMELSGTWGAAWGGRRIGLFNRGGMKMDWFLVHQHGVGHPCDVDSVASATCGNTGVGSMFPARHAQLGYATPELGGLQLSVAALDPAMIDASWNRTTAPRFEAELVFHQTSDRPIVKDEINVWANALSQQIGRVGESAPNPATMDPGIAADATRSVWGVGGGVWGRYAGFALGGTGWIGDGLGTAWALGNTAIDATGHLRRHFGYLGAANYRIGPFEIASFYGSANVKETAWDAAPNNALKISVIKEVRGIGGKIAWHIDPIVFSIDWMDLQYTWHRGEQQHADTISGGMLAEW
ncbi:MAG TPA: porin [Polyangiaceae bacterium]|nr:porin [Polyangiaceae bacterium]